MAEIYGVIGTSNYANLLADPQGADSIGINCKPGNGKVARGTLMYREASGMYAPAAAEHVTASHMLVVLNEDVDTGDSGAVAEAAAAYRAGRFIDGAVTLAANGSLSAANKAVLNLMNIVFTAKEGTGVVDNGGFTITYKANNGASPAEADVIQAKLAGESYTILSNSDAALSFAAPEGKSFSKWNTGSDGAGTDYAVGAVYSTDADLTLYAVWV